MKIDVLSLLGGSCRKGRDCPFSHDKELRRKELEKKGKGKGSDSYPAKGDGKGGKGKGKGGKGKAGDAKKKKSEKQRPYFAKNGACKKGADCDMSHVLATDVGATGSGGGQGSAPSGWAAPSGNSVLNPGLVLAELSTPSS